jgi:hypothetical protein
VLLPVFDPNLLVAYHTDEDQVFIQMDIVISKLGCKGCIASQVVVVISHHHGHSYASPGGSKLIENRLMGVNYVLKLFSPVHESEFPEPERITHDE